jgi:hypothetical protein
MRALFEHILQPTVPLPDHQFMHARGAVLPQCCPPSSDEYIGFIDLLPQCKPDGSKEKEVRRWPTLAGVRFCGR